MQRWVAILLLLCATPLWGQTSLTERSGFKNSSNFSGTQGTFNLGFGNGGTTAVNDLIVTSSDVGVTGTATTTTDSLGNTYHACGGGPYNDSGNSNINTWYTVVTTGGANPTIHFNVSGSFTGYFGVQVDVFTGEATGGGAQQPCDSVGSGQNAGTSSTSWSTTGFSTTCANEMVFANLVSSTGTQSPSGPGGGWTTVNVNNGYISAYQNFSTKQTSTGTNYTATVSSAKPYTGIASGFCAAMQPASSFMMPFVAQVISRFWPEYLRLYSEGNHN